MEVGEAEPDHDGGGWWRLCLRMLSNGTSDRQGQPSLKVGYVDGSIQTNMYNIPRK